MAMYWHVMVPHHHQKVRCYQAHYLVDGLLLMNAGHASATEFLEESYAAVATIQPVRPSWCWSFRALLPRLWLWLTEWIDPIHDNGADEDVSDKILGIYDVLSVGSRPIL